MDTRVNPFVALAVFLVLVSCATSAELDPEDESPPSEADTGTAPLLDGGVWTSNASDAAWETDVGSDAVEADVMQEADADAPLVCDSRFSFSTAVPKAGKPFTASFTDDTGYVDVDLVPSGPGAPVATWKGVTGDGPFKWSYHVEGQAAGALELVFFKNKPTGSNGKKVASCSLQILP